MGQRVGLFVVLHAVALTALWTDFPCRAVTAGVAVYLFHMLALAIAHRYFEHRAFKTGRVLQFVIACCAAATLQVRPTNPKFRELRLLDALAYVPAALLADGCFAVAGWTGIVIGFVWPTVLARYVVLANARYDRNSWLFAALTCGDGWHDNHRRSPSSARHGFRWWQIDLAYYVLGAAELLGLVWELRQPPDEILELREEVAR